MTSQAIVLYAGPSDGEVIESKGPAESVSVHGKGDDDTLYVYEPSGRKSGLGFDVYELTKFIRRASK